jgi:cytochrome c553
MWTHFQRVGEVQSAVIRGDLAGTRSAATWIADHEEVQGLPAASAPFVTEMKGYAQEVAQAEHVLEAALGTGRMASACGSCHRSAEKGPRFNVVSRPETGTGPVTTQMLKHIWAADRMWDGLIGPSDSSWTAGAIAMADITEYERGLSATSGNADDVRALARRARDLSTRAAMASTQNARGEIYGEFLATCAACHQMMGVGRR